MRPAWPPPGNMPPGRSRATTPRPARLAAVVTALALVTAAPAMAQPVPRVSLAFSGGAQVTETGFTDRFTFDLHRETATTRVEYPVRRSGLLDAGAAVRLWRRFGVGFTVSRFERDGVAETVAAMPHPLYFDEHREVTGTAEAIRRDETGLHLQAQYQIPVTSRLEVVLAAGPSFLRTGQELVTAVRHEEQYPYDTAEFIGVQTRSATASGAGFNASADVRWMFTRRLGAGAIVRVTRATVPLDSSGSGSVATAAGGAHVAAGLRVAF